MDEDKTKVFDDKIVAIFSILAFIVFGAILWVILDPQSIVRGNTWTAREFAIAVLQASMAIIEWLQIMPLIIAAIYWGVRSNSSDVQRYMLLFALWGILIQIALWFGPGWLARIS